MIHVTKDGYRYELFLRQDIPNQWDMNVVLPWTRQFINHVIHVNRTDPFAVDSIRYFEEENDE